VNLDLAAFALGERVFRIAEVLAVAWLEGSLDRPVEQLVQHGSSEGSVSRADLQAALDAWRTERDLIAAEDAERWLAYHDITLGQVVQYLKRKLLPSPPPLDSPQAWSLLPETLALSGELPRLVERIARRAVVPSVPTPEARAALLAERGCAEASLGPRLAQLGVEPQTAGLLLDLAAAFRVWQAEHLSPAALTEELSGAEDRLRLLRTCFRTLDQAREALCCVREDAEPLQQVALRTGMPWEDYWALSGTEERLARARPGESRGPFQIEGRWIVWHVIEHAAPDLSDPVVHERLRERRERRLLSGEVAHRVRFLYPPP
jgi:hypothetical protein